MACKRLREAFAFTALARKFKSRRVHSNSVASSAGATEPVTAFYYARGKTVKTVFESERIIIRPLKESDEEAVYEGARHEEVARYLIRLPHPYPREITLPFIRGKIKEFEEGSGYSFAVELKETGRLIGIVGLHEVDAKDKSAKLGYWLAKEHWGKGLATEAVGLLLEFAFQEAGFHRVEGSAFAENKASQRVQEKLGFKREGVRREAVYKDGGWHDAFAYGILKNEYKGLKSAKP